jgi:DNA-binding protein H-NS
VGSPVTRPFRVIWIVSFLQECAYRDPKNSENTWTGGGRMPRSMVAATKGNKAKREDFLVK